MTPKDTAQAKLCDAARAYAKAVRSGEGVKVNRALQGLLDAALAYPEVAGDLESWHYFDKPIPLTREGKLLTRKADLDFMDGVQVYVPGWETPIITVITVEVQDGRALAMDGSSLAYSLEFQEGWVCTGVRAASLSCESASGPPYPRADTGRPA